MDETTNGAAEIVARRERMTALAATLTDEDEGFALLMALQDRFGWEGSMFTFDGDLVPRLNEVMNDEFSRDATDDEIRALSVSWEWRKGLADSMTEHGWDIIGFAIDEIVAAARTEPTTES